MAKQDINTKIQSYINKVIDDAIRAVNVDAVLDHWYVIVGNDLILDLKFTKSPSKQNKAAEILKRAMFRLGNGIPRHFKLSVYAPNLYHYYPDGIGTDYSFAPNGNFNYEYAITEVHPFGADMVLCHEYGDPVYPMDMDGVVDDLEKIPIVMLQKNGLDIHNSYFFSDFFAAYVKSFGETPLNVWIQMRAGNDVSKLDSAEYIETQANDDLDTYGCKYYSVCDKACKGCVATEKCFRDKPIMKDGLVLSRYREFKQELLMGKLK